jgi:hypothetical protein
MFFKFFNVFPRSSQYHFKCIPYALANIVAFSPIWVGQKERTSFFKIDKNDEIKF